MQWSPRFHEAREPKQKFYVDGPRDVVHENPYVVLEYALTSLSCFEGANALITSLIK